MPIRFRNIIASALLLVGLTLHAQAYSDEIVVERVDGDYITVRATGVDKDKKKARALAEQSVFNALMHSGFSELKQGVPMVASKRSDYDFRLMSESRYISYISGEIKQLEAKKINDLQRVTVRFTVALKAFQKDLERNNIALNPTWQDAKKANPTAALNPTIVVVPDVDGDFESMRSVVRSSPFMRHAVNAVSAEFSKRGYKTRDFIAQLENSKTRDLLTSGTQSDVRTLVAQQLPGDIVIYVSPTVSQSPAGWYGTLALKAIERQTAGNLATVTYQSSGFIKADSIALADYAIKKSTADFFNSLTQAFADMVAKGREVAIEFTLDSALADWDFDQDSPLSGNFFKDALDEWLRTKAYRDVYEMGVNTDKYISATLNVPLWDMEKNRSYSLSNFGSELRRFFKSELGTDYSADVTALGQRISVIIK